MATARVDHAREIAALAAVVREVFAQLEAHAREPTESARGALAAVERWLAGEPVSTEDLAAAAERAWSELASVPWGQRDLVLSWSNTAAGNLASVTRKLRGWQDGRRTVLDAAASAVSTLRAPNTWSRPHFEARHAEVYANSEAKVRAPKLPNPAKRVTRRHPIAARLGAHATRRLVQLEAEVRPQLRVDEQALAAFLADRDYPVHASVVAFEADYGGLVFAEHTGDAAGDWLVGAYACLASRTHGEPRGGRPRSGKEALVPVAYSPNDTIFYLDGDGVGWAEDTIEGGLQRVADDGVQLLARIVQASAP
jgi:hypothetical protein